MRTLAAAVPASRGAHASAPRHFESDAGADPALPSSRRRRPRPRSHPGSPGRWLQRPAPSSPGEERRHRGRSRPRHCCAPRGAPPDRSDDDTPGRLQAAPRPLRGRPLGWRRPVPGLGLRGTRQAPRLEVCPIRRGIVISESEESQPRGLGGRQGLRVQVSVLFVLRSRQRQAHDHLGQACCQCRSHGSGAAAPGRGLLRGQSRCEVSDRHPGERAGPFTHEAAFSHAAPTHSVPRRQATRVRPVARDGSSSMVQRRSRSRCTRR